ncbi:MAG: hypothetical protein N2053_00850, partial [Chitinispirillaceae bacterium]|nr:hypothetical protein [Chitinispirillaceae bacterium]
MKIKIVKPTEEDIIHMAKMIRSLFKIEKDFSSNIELHKKGVSMLMKKKNGIIYIEKYGKERIGMIFGQIVISTSVGGYSVW